MEAHPQNPLSGLKLFFMIGFPWIFFQNLVKKFILPICLLISAQGLGQDPFIHKLTGSLEEFETKNPQEKVYLQTDKSFYIPGEICWFKAYLVDAALHKPFPLSKVTYVELINHDSKPVMQGKISMLNGFGSGSFFLPLYLPSGSYKIRAYTSWMKNFGPEYFFEKNVTIVNTQKIDRDSIVQRTAAFDIQFFPEGGNLVEGLTTVVGFKAVDEKGIGINVEGDIVDQNKNTLAHFKSLRFGMGRFSFTPSSGSQYKAYVRISENQLTVVNLPTVIPKGYSLSVTSDANNLVNITAFSNYEEDNRPLYLFIHTRGIVKYAQPLKLSVGRGSVSIPTSDFGEGISCITLFNSSQQPVCERLYFHMPGRLDISAQSEMEEYKTRKKISSFIRINANNPNSDISHLGLSVYRLDSLQNEDASDIRSYLYLSSDIRGNIEHPEYYFNHNGEQADESLDNLMLTQGWRRFNWDVVLQSKTADYEFIPEWSGHLISAKISDRITGQPMENQSVYLAGPGIKSQLAGSFSNKKGQLLFDLPHLLGSNVIVVQNENRTDTNYRIDVSNPFSEKFSNRLSPDFRMNVRFKDEIQFYNVSTQVENVYLLDNRIKFTAPATKDSTAFYGEPDKKYFLDDYTRFNTMEEVIREYVAGVSVHKRQNKFYFRIMNDPQKQFFDTDPLIVLDGVPIFDATEVMALDPLRIKKIEIVNKKYYLGSLIANGILALYSYNNDMAGMQMNSHALILEYEGLQLQREFYSPKYDVSKPASKRLPDFRNTLIWEPNIVIGKTGEAQVNFYSSDRKGKYVGIVEGINQNGLAGSARFYFEVQ
jgi:hypothetical protein